MCGFGGVLVFFSFNGRCNSVSISLDPDVTPFCLTIFSVELKIQSSVVT